MDASFVLLPGDGIGPEIIEQAKRVLQSVAEQFSHSFSFQECIIGGIAIDSTGTPLPNETIEACKDSTAVLLGAVGGPKWDDPNAKTRPEAGLLQIRKELELFANLRPITPFAQLIDASPLKREIVEGTDILFFRELTGGIYFGPSAKTQLPDGGERAESTMVYETHEIERIFRLAADAARQRRGKLTMV
ncbi:MAG TPA: 3-isopropylmalate dehydrogenase, partial [Planctomycetaceae bacterium]|nr:3-isopropylmalate dehydrogenase [Planctomycetaceae bacterium]